jgi:mono/diheme cytochrome c family protein
MRRFLIAGLVLAAAACSTAPQPAAAPPPQASEAPSSSPAPSQVADGDVVRGHAYALQLCASCHAIDPGETRSPVPGAPTFQAAANARGMTEMALNVWMQSSHPTMPNVVVKPETMNHLVAYILSLKTPR